MALNIKNREVESLVDEVVAKTGETKTEAVRKALLERKERLELQVARPARAERARAFLETEVWPFVPPETLGTSLTREEEERLLGFGEAGV